MSRSDPTPLSLVRGNAPIVGTESRLTVVWVGGDQDASTVAAVAEAIERAADLDDAVVVDLSAVTFMDTSIIHTLIAAQHRLEARSQSLLVRGASPAAARLLSLCALPTHTSSTSEALGTWVSVPVAPAAPTGLVVPIKPAPEVSGLRDPS